VLNPDALGGYISDTVLRVAKMVRHYGQHANENYYDDSSAPSPPPVLYFPIVRDAFAHEVLRVVPVRQSLIGRIDPWYRSWDLNTPRPVPVRGVEARVRRVREEWQSA
jgi:hypothetical protein